MVAVALFQGLNECAYIQHLKKREKIKRKVVVIINKGGG